VTTKKDKILDCALLLFSQQGIESTSTAQISKEAGVAKGTLFHHFSNKAVLVDELFFTLKQALFGSLSSSYEGANDRSPHDQLKRHWRDGMKWAVTHPVEMRFFAQVHFHPASEKRSGVINQLFEPLEIKIIEAQNAGSIAPIDLEAIRHFTHSHFLSSASVMNDCSMMSAMAHDEYTELTFQMFWRAIGGTV
jgi:AcrR family transcriptional regulator